MKSKPKSLMKGDRAIGNAFRKWDKIAKEEQTEEDYAYTRSLLTQLFRDCCK